MSHVVMLQTGAGATWHQSHVDPLAMQRVQDAHGKHMRVALTERTHTKTYVCVVACVQQYRALLWRFKQTMNTASAAQNPVPQPSSNHSCGPVRTPMCVPFPLSLLPHSLTTAITAAPVRPPPSEPLLPVRRSDRKDKGCEKTRQRCRQD